MPYADPKKAREYNAAHHREWKKKNPERALARGRAWRARNIDSLRAADAKLKRDIRGTLDGWAKHIVAQHKSVCSRKGLAPVTFTVPELTAAFVSWDRSCGCCGKQGLTFCFMADHSRLTSAVVEHDHATGHLRGFCCHRCNLMLGLIEDEPFLEQCQRYLKGTKR